MEPIKKAAHQRRLNLLLELNNESRRKPLG
jgi:hypothetical protein